MTQPTAIVTEPIEFTARRFRCPHCRHSYAHKLNRHQAHRSVLHQPGGALLQDIDALSDEPMCSECGSGMDHDGVCPNGHSARPIHGMTVHCGQWAVTP